MQLYESESFVGAIFGPTLSEKGQLCKKGLKYQVVCQKKPTACHIWYVCHRFATPAIGYACPTFFSLLVPVPSDKVL